MANVVIDIASEFTGAKAFKQADSATQKLTNNVKKLAATVGLAYSTTRVLAYAKSSVKAAAADQKAQQQLALALKNVGLERDAATSEALIQRLQSEYGIVDDLLRPAYQSLAIATRDTAESQRLLNLALDISAATGKDLGSVTAALSKAYLGNNTALTRLGVGISKADLKTKSFYDITTDLQDTFKGSATAAANTFQGSMDKLGVASANVSEIIGTSLIDALKGLGNQDSVDNLASSMERVAQRTGDVIRGVGVLIGKLKQLPGMPDFSVLYDISYLRLLEKIGSASRAGSAGGFPQGPPSDLTRQFPKPADKTDKIAKETLKYNKESLKLAKAKATFDLEKIQIEAALKGKLSEEDKIRLKLLQAIEEENIANADKYQKALEKSQEKTKELAALLASVKAMEIKDPFSQWSIDPLTASINALTTSIGGVGTAITASGKEWSSFTGNVASTVIQPNLKEFSSSFTLAVDGITTSFATAVTGLTTLTTSASKAASDAALAATAAANAALTSTSSTATAAIGEATTSTTDATNTAIASSGIATAVTIVDTSQSAADALDKLYSDSTTALTNATTATVTDFMATSSAALDSLKAILEAEAINYAAQAAAASAQAAADAADIAGAGNAGNNVEITVNTGIGDPNAIAEAISEVLRNAASRGTLDTLGID